MKGNLRMYSKAWFAFPVAVKLSGIYLGEDVLMHGDLQDEYEKLISKHLHFKRNKKLCANVNQTYLKGTNLWSVTEDLLERFHLIPVVYVEGENVYLNFEKGSAWKER